MQLFMRSLVYLLAVVTGIGLVTAAMTPATVVPLLQTYLELLQTPAGRFSTGAVGLLYLLLPLALGLRWYASRRFAREISYQTESGQVSVSLQAIEEALARAVELDEAVRKVHLKVYDDRVKKQVRIVCVLTLWDDGDVTGINRRCQDLIQARFSELMPEQTVVDIHINVHRLTQRPDRSADQAPPAAPVPDPSADPERTPQSGVPLPGLTATQGQISNQAGAALLARRRQSTDDEIVDAPATDLPTPPEPEEQGPGSDIDFEAIEQIDDDPMQNLYVGPQYTVEPDEDDEPQR